MTQTDINFVRGDTQRILFKLKNGDSYYTLGQDDRLYMTAKFKGSIVFQKTIDDGITHDAETGYYTITIASSDTCDLKEGKYPFDIELVRDFSASKNTKTLICGNLVLSEGVTQRGDEV